MRRFYFLIALLFIVGASSSCNKAKKKMEVVRDCTGQYLRAKNGLDYLVCNFAILDPYETGDKIEVEYDLMEECFGLIEPVTCSTPHLFESRIDVTKVY